MRTMNKLTGEMLSCVLKVSVCGGCDSREKDKYRIYFKCNRLHSLSGHERGTKDNSNSCLELLREDLSLTEIRFGRVSLEWVSKRG